MEKLRRYQTTNKARRIIHRKLAQTCRTPAAAHLVDVFHSLDPINSGAITVEGLKVVLHSGAISDPELQGETETEPGVEIVDKFSTPICPSFPAACQITFSDFVAVMLASEFPRNLSALQLVFNLIDVSKSSFVTSHNLYFTSYLMGLSIKPNEILASTSEFQDKLDFNAFVQMLSQSTSSSIIMLGESPDHESSTDSEGMTAMLQSHAEAQKNTVKMIRATPVPALRSPG